MKSIIDFRPMIKNQGVQLLQHGPIKAVNSKGPVIKGDAQATTCCLQLAQSKGLTLDQGCRLKGQYVNASKGRAGRPVSGVSFIFPHIDPECRYAVNTKDSPLDMRSEATKERGDYCISVYNSGGWHRHCVLKAAHHF